MGAAERTSSAFRKGTSVRCRLGVVVFEGFRWGSVVTGPGLIGDLTHACIIQSTSVARCVV